MDCHRHHIFTAVTFNLTLGAAHLRDGYGLGTVGSQCQEDCHIDVDIETEPPTPPPQSRPERLASSSCCPAPSKVPLGTVKKFSPDPSERFLSVAVLVPRQTNPSPQEIITVRYFPDFSRALLLERERTCKEVENCHQPTLTGNFLSRIPPWKLCGNRLFPQVGAYPQPHT